MSWLKQLNRFSPWLMILFAAILRLFQIGKRDFWYDEAFTGNLIRHDWATMMKEIAYDIHPPLHYIFLKAFAFLFGDSVTSLRTFSVICGIASVGLVYLIARELKGKQAGLYASFIAAIAPFAIQYSQEARMYALYGALILLATYCFVRALHTNKYSWWIGWGVSFALSCLTHYMGLLFLGCFVVAWLIAKAEVKKIWQGSLRERLPAIKNLLPSPGLLLGSVTGYLVFLPWKATFLRQLDASKDISTWKAPAHFIDLMRDVQIFFFGTPKGELSPWSFDPNKIANMSSETVVLLLAFLLPLMIMVALRREQRKTLLALTFFLGILLMAYALSYFEKYYFISRYVFPGAYFLYIFLGIWLSGLKLPRAGIALSIYVLLIIFIQPLTNSQGYNELKAQLSKYDAYHFYSLNTFDYVISKYYLHPERLTLYNVGWPQYDSRPWPGVGYQTKRTENFDDLKNDPNGIVIWNTQFPKETRDDRNFDTSEFEQIAKYKNIELYRPKKFLQE